MTLYDFIKLDEEQKAIAVWQGNFLAFREEKGCKVLLYKMDSLYVEVYYNNEHNMIRWIRPFKTHALLSKYFDSTLN